MMYRLSNVKAPLSFTLDVLPAMVARELRLNQTTVCSCRLAKKSVDARRKSDVHFVLSIDFALADGAQIPKHPNLSPLVESPYVYRRPTAAMPKHRPVVVGFGPAGMMAALALAEAGMRPIVLERGRDVDTRARDVERFWLTGQLDPDSNVQFGEGGAGTFSDGKLTTGIKDPRCAEVLRTFAAHGAPKEILYQSKPHIGTDKLPGMVKSIRQRIQSLGGEVRFETRLESVSIEDGRVSGVRQADGTELPAADLILAIGHSARDTMSMLHALGVLMRRKPFSIGARIEHPQALIDQSQYGDAARHPALGAADYKLSERLPSGRGVYTFCMCPGGQVVAAASEPGHLVVNGMSAFARDGANANSALLVSVEPTDFPGDDPLSGFAFQEQYERLAFELGGHSYKAPAQLVGDFLRGIPSESAREVIPTYRPGVTWTDIARCLPPFAVDALRQALPLFDRRIRGFASPGTVLTGVETRSSSPVTIERDQHRMCPNVTGLYPCGEGAGYAGGIMSAAVDGLRCAEAVIERYLTGEA